MVGMFVERVDLVVVVFFRFALGFFLAFLLVVVVIELVILVTRTLDVVVLVVCSVFGLGLLICSAMSFPMIATLAIPRTIFCKNLPFTSTAALT